MVNDEKTRKPLYIAAEAAGTPTAGPDARLTEREKRLLQIIRESEDPIALLMVALGAAADCLKQLEQFEQPGPAPLEEFDEKF